MSQAEKFVIEKLPWKKKGKSPKEVPYPLPEPGNICWCALARRQSGKTTLFCNLVRAYRRFFERIIILSPTARYDKIWDNVKYPNVFVGDEVTNETLSKIAETQIEVFDQSKPKENRCLLIIDDSSSDLKRKQLRYMFTKFTTLFRHWGGDLIWACHNLTFMEGSQIQNALQWCVWDTNKKALKKFCDDTATARMDEDSLIKFIKSNTTNPYDFVYIDYSKSPDETFWVKFDHVYKP